MNCTWTVVADAGRARIFERRSANQALAELESFFDPEAGARPSASDAGEQGRFSSAAGGVGHRPEHRSDPNDKEARRFAGHIATRLEQAHRAGRFQHLELVAPPRFLGVLRQVLARDLLPLVQNEWAKDWTLMPIADLDERLRSQEPPSPSL